MGSSLSVVRIKKNMIYMKVEDPPGANKKFSPKEFLCRHLKIVIALALISTAMSVTSLVIAVTHMHGEDGGNIDLGDMGFRTANENSSTKMVIYDSFYQGKKSKFCSTKDRKGLRMTCTPCTALGVKRP